jgi:eukaryotic-like serine/threonine-protein kinase
LERVIGELIAGRYELEELTGSGGMSRVYRARDRQLARPVAVKILHERHADDPEHVERFRREARAVARLSHPNIVTVLDRGESEGRQYIVFEHVEGDDLKQLVARTGPLPVRRALELAIEIARALAFAHAEGIVHRDVKPQNILLRDGTAKVSDFGIARADDPELQGEHTETGTVLGTGDYISPEQARGERATECSDVYSLGALLYELLTGHVPYPAESAVAAAMRHTTDPVPDVLAERPDVPVRVGAAVTRAMAKDPAERFHSMDGVVCELVACFEELPIADAAQTMILPEPPRVPEADPAAPPGREGRRSARVPLLLLLLLLLVLAGAGAYYLVARHDKSPVGGPKPAAAATAVHLDASRAYDPQGDNRERDDLVSRATDGSATTFWQTEHYTTAQFGNLKQGVGLVLDAGSTPVRLQTLTIQTPTPGFVAEIEAASQDGPFAPVSSPQSVGTSTTFKLHVPAARRLYMIWITRLTRFDTGDASKPFGARIAEVSAT